MVVVVYAVISSADGRPRESPSPSLSDISGTGGNTQMSHSGYVPGILGVEDSVAWSRVQIGCTTHQNTIVKRVPYGGRDSAVHGPNPSQHAQINLS